MTGEPDTQRVLMRLLATAFGDESTGRVLVHAALRSARRAALPSEPAALLDFVRAHLMGSLTEELGPRLVTALLDELAHDLAELHSPPSTRRAIAESPAVSDVPKSSGVRSRSSVLLIDNDRFARSNLARTLIAGSCDVGAAETPLDVRSHDGDIDVAVVSMDMPDAAAVLGALLAKQPQIRVVGVAKDVASAEALMRAANVRVYRVVPRTTRGADMVDLVKRMSA